MPQFCSGLCKKHSGCVRGWPRLLCGLMDACLANTVIIASGANRTDITHYTERISLIVFVLPSFPPTVPSIRWCLLSAVCGVCFWERHGAFLLRIGINGVCITAVNTINNRIDVVDYFCLLKKRLIKQTESQAMWYEVKTRTIRAFLFFSLYKQ